MPRTSSRPLKGEEEKAELQELMTYSEDTAGSLMTTDFVEIADHQTVGEAMELVREAAGEIESIYYVYVHDDDGKLIGALSLRHLLAGGLAAAMGNIMQPRLVTLHTEAPVSEVADTFLRYFFLALPVIDDDGLMRGVVTFKHSFDQLIPHLYRAWKADSRRD